MGFSYNDITSKSMGLKARLTSWQVSGSLRNFTTTVPGKYGVTDFGADFDYREIVVSCSIFPRHSFSALVSTLNPGSRRKAKAAKGIYLMEKSQKCAILVECGFLSNAEEEAKLASPDYQKAMAAVIAAAVGTKLG